MSRGFAIILFSFSVAAVAETNFLDLYTCVDKWEEINGRAGYRILDCNASQVRTSESCTGANFICFGIVRCMPKPGAQFPEGTDPDYPGAEFEYEAACHARNATDCKSPLECAQESMEKGIIKGGPVRRSSGSERGNQ